MAILGALKNTNWLVLGFSILSLALLLGFKKYAPRQPSVLITVVIATLLAWLVGYEQHGGQVIGAIPAGLPPLNIPIVDMEFKVLASLFMTALVIGLIGFVEAISIAKAMASQTRQRLSANQELIGQGLANMSAGLFGGYAVSGSFSRSAVNFTAGAVTGFSSVVTGLLVALTLLFLTPLLYHLPQATLGAVIIMAVINLIKISPIRHAWKVEPQDGMVALVTFIATLIFAPHLDKGILLGVVLSLVLFLYRTMRPHFAEVVRHPDGSLRDAASHHLQTSETVAVYRFDGELYFANSGYLEGKLLNALATKPKLKVIVLDLESVDHIDSTGEEMLTKMADRLQSAGIEFLMARAKYAVYKTLERSGFIDKVGRERFFRERTQAVRYAKDKLGDAIDIEPFLHTMPLPELEPEEKPQEEAEVIPNELAHPISAA